MFNFCYSFFLFLHNLRNKKKHWLSFLWMAFIVPFFFFLFHKENRYMIHHDLDLFYDMHDTVNEHNQRQTRYLSLIQIILISIFNWIKTFFYNFFCFIVHHNFHGITISHGIKIFLKKKKKNDNMAMNVTKISQKMKNKILLGIEKI